MTIEEAFTKVVGRAASDDERERLHKLREALGLRDNDAFWSIVIALEYYDSFFRQYPAQLAEETRRCIEGARSAFAAAAGQEAARMHRVLSEEVARASAATRKLAGRTVGLPTVTTALSLVVAFGALCLGAGYHLATPERPYWTLKEPGLTAAERGLSTVLAVPAGWMVFALLLPAALYGVKVGWAMAADTIADRQDRIAGWGLVAACGFGCVACALLIAKVT